MKFTLAPCRAGWWGGPRSFDQLRDPDRASDARGWRGPRARLCNAHHGMCTQQALLAMRYVNR